MIVMYKHTFLGVLLSLSQKVGAWRRSDKYSYTCTVWMKMFGAIILDRDKAYDKGARCVYWD